MAKAIRINGQNRLMDRIDAGLDPTGTTKRSPAMANAPAVVPKPKTPLGSAAAQKAYAPPAPGIDNRLKPVGAAVAAPFSVGGAMGGMINSSRERNYDFRQNQMDAFGTDMSKPRTFLPSTNATMDQISREGEAYRQQLEGPVMPPNLSPQGQEAWAANQRMQRNAANQGAVQNSLAGGGARAMGPNGMPLRSSAGALPNTVQPVLGAGGRTVLRPDGSPMVERVPSQSQPGQLADPVDPERQQLASRARREFIPEVARDIHQNRLAALQEKIDAGRSGGPGPKYDDKLERSYGEAEAELRRRMDAQRAGPDNKKWEDARQERIASHKTKRELISARGIQDASDRRARLNARKGYLAETAFKGMTPEQQLTYMTGGRSRSQMGDTSAAREDLYRAQADAMRTQNDLNKSMIDAQKNKQSEQPGAEAPAPYDVTPQGKLGIPQGIGSRSMVDGIIDSSIDINNPQSRQQLQEWAKTPMDPEGGILGGLFQGPWNSEAKTNNALRKAIKSGDWDAAQKIIDEAKASRDAVDMFGEGRRSG